MGTHRDYKLTDSEAIRAATVLLEHYKLHEADFTAFDAQFGPAWQNDWQAAIDLAISQPTDEKTLDEQYQLTEAVEQKTAEALRSIEDLQYYVQKAFGAGSPEYRALNYRQPSLLIRYPHRVLVNTLVASELASLWQAELMAAGMPAALISNLQTRADELLQAEKEQELFKRQRLLRTAQRVKILNNMWAYVRQVSDAASIIYRDKQELKKLFVVRNSVRSEA